MLAVLSACGNSKQSESKDMNTLTFNERQAACMSAIACNEAQGDLVSLESAIHNGLEADLTVSQIKEALSQLYAYTGFPRSLNALGVLQRVVGDREAKGVKVLAGSEASALPKDYDALKQGTEVQTQLSGQPFNYDFCPAEDYYLKAHLFGDIFARDKKVDFATQSQKPSLHIYVGNRRQIKTDPSYHIIIIFEMFIKIVIVTRIFYFWQNLPSIFNN